MNPSTTGCKVLREYDNLTKAGAGGYGLVLRAKKVGENFYSAIKLIPKNDPTTAHQTLSEAQKLSSISSHDSIVSCLEHWEDEFTKDDHSLFVAIVKPKKDEPFYYFPTNTRTLKFLCIRMEYCENGTLKQWLKGRESDIDVWENIQIFLQLARGVEHIHAHKLIHRDVKPANILFHKKNAKISDLGWSATHNTGEYQHTPRAGAALYQSPEQAFGEYGQASDFYALGLILFELFSPEAQKNVGQALVSLKYNRQIPMEIRCSYPIIADLIVKLISVDPKKRPSCDRIVLILKPLLENLKPSVEGLLKLKTDGNGEYGDVDGCEHYRRKCKVKCPFPECGAANGFYGCRFCHDEDIKGHKMDRFKVQEILCSSCGVQQFPRSACLVCKVKFAKYFCSTCNIFDDSENATLIYHCHLCGICRKKAHESLKYKHCDRCSMCYPSAVITEDDEEISDDSYFKHECKKEAGKMPCYVCHKDVHNSREPAVLVNCQHYVHEGCKDLFPSGVENCPLCGWW